uniref:RNA-directed RNA polymerase n=1 Tax=Macrostomum lignano TaxID=282301 RepID=A0A1I8FL66_9PLAT
VNVLLIPAGPDCRASLAADCSGGDLDGDQFSVPKKALEKVLDEGYPDFMEKPAKKTYKSEKLLGQLYRRCLTYALDWDLLEQAVAQPTGTETDSANNPILSWPGWRDSPRKLESSWPLPDGCSGPAGP